MITRIWNFIKRHRRKFVYTGFLIGGGYALIRYLRWRLGQYQEEQMSKAFAQVRRQQHFDSNQRTCNSTVLSLIPTLRENIIKELNCEQLQTQLQNKPSNRVHIWSELKLIAYSRAMISIYSVCLLVVIMRVQLNIIGGFIYAKNQPQEQPNELESTTPISTEVQQKYLEAIQYYINTGLYKLITAVRHSIEREMLSITLKQQFSVGEVEEMLSRVRHSIEGVNPAYNQLIQYILPALQTQTDDPVLSGLYKETEEIITSTDFDQVLMSVVNKGFDYFYSLQSNTINSCMTPAKNGRLIVVNRAPLAKLIPSASSSLYHICTETAQDFMERLLTLPELNILSQNIYEAFSSPLRQQPAAAS